MAQSRAGSVPPLMPLRSDPPPPTRRTWLAERLRGVHPPRWWEEVGIILLGYWLYSLVRNGVPTHETAALERARDLLAVERTLHIGIEHSVNAFVASVQWLAVGANYYYATLHFVVTIGVLVWLYLRHPLRYRAVRTVLFTTNLIALLGFWLFALAPPRMLPGYVDTVVQFGTWGSYASGDLAEKSNQFAAMPSLHVGWSLWCGIVVFTLARRRLVRTLAVIYPILTIAVIIATANHFILDAVGGAVTLGLAFALQRVVSGRTAFALPARTTPSVGRSHPVRTAA
jgi:hypothetical protein